VEAATLASAQPPEPTYKPKLPPACTTRGEKSLLSTLQYVRNARTHARTHAPTHVKRYVVSNSTISPCVCMHEHRKPW
jgi:hypothetical protein